MNSQIEILLKKESEKLGMTLSKLMLESFEEYMRLLDEWGKKINLTSLKSPEEVVRFHFLDSLTLVAYLPRANNLSLVDVGSGAGFPGAVCALMKPGWNVTLVERVQKKAGFLAVLRRTLDLSNVEIMAQDIAKVSNLFDVAVSRATFPPIEWVNLGTRLIRAGGLLVAMTSLENAPAGPCKEDFVEAMNLEYTVGRKHRALLGWTKNVPRGTNSSEPLSRRLLTP